MAQSPTAFHFAKIAVSPRSYSYRRTASTQTGRSGPAPQATANPKLQVMTGPEANLAAVVRQIGALA